MDNLVKQLEEVYQDIEYRGKTYKGRRDCESRWQMIEKYINPHDVVLDIGSSLGYFSKKIAKAFPDSLVISFESDPVMCQIQKKIFKDEGIYNAVVCNHRLSKDDLEKWEKHVEFFDVVLALSVLHHYPQEDVVQVWRILRSMAEKIIGELPEKYEEACGEEAKQKAWEIIFNKVHWVGTTPSHLGDFKRKLWVVKNEVERENLDAFFGVAHEDRHKFKIKGDTLNSKHIIKGVNVWNLLHFNIVWPESDWWQKQARTAYECFDKPTDIRPWNLLVTSIGLKAIDCNSWFPANDKAGYNIKWIDRLAEVFKEMKPCVIY